MLNIKKALLLIFNTIFILCLFSCSVKDIFVDDNIVAETTAAYFGDYYVTNDTAAMRMSAKAANGQMSMLESADIEENISDERKIIKNYNVTGETKTFDQTYQLLGTEIKRLNGIIDNQSIENQNVLKDRKQKYLYMTVRIPSESAEQFYIFLNNNINILSRHENQEDITDNYNDTKLRIETLKEEQERLKQLFAKATTVEDLVKIENRISDIGYEIQRLENRISNFDKKVNYSTFNININEVILYTEPETVIPTKEDLIIKFNENFEKCKTFLIGIGIYIFTHLPAIVLCLIIALILLLVLQIILNNTLFKINKYKSKISENNNTKNNTNKNNTTNVFKNEKKVIKQSVQVNNNNNKRITIPKSTHYGDVGVRVMSDAEIEHDKKLKAIEDEKYNNEKQINDKQNYADSISQNSNTNQEITDIKTLMEQKVDE